MTAAEDVEVSHPLGKNQLLTCHGLSNQGEQCIYVMTLNQRGNLIGFAEDIKVRGFRIFFTKFLPKFNDKVKCFVAFTSLS